MVSNAFDILFAITAIVISASIMITSSAVLSGSSEYVCDGGVLADDCIGNSIVCQPGRDCLIQATLSDVSSAATTTTTTPAATTTTTTTTTTSATTTSATTATSTTATGTTMTTTTTAAPSVYSVATDPDADEPSTFIPTIRPTATDSQDSSAPSTAPTTTVEPTETPTKTPTSTPTSTPTRQPTPVPSATPSSLPTSTSTPSSRTPTSKPSSTPTTTTTRQPTAQSSTVTATTTTTVPVTTLTTTLLPTTFMPTEKPTSKPTISTTTTDTPTVSPTVKPTTKPTLKPTMKPSLKPTEQPTTDSSDDSDRRRRRLLQQPSAANPACASNLNQGACDSHVLCPAGHRCEIYCDLPCDGMVVNATQSTSLRVFGCNHQRGFDTCGNMQIYCPVHVHTDDMIDTDADQDGATSAATCVMQSAEIDSLGTPKYELDSVTIFSRNAFDDVSIESLNVISSYLYCGDAQQFVCKLNVDGSACVPPNSECDSYPSMMNVSPTLTSYTTTDVFDQQNIFDEHDDVDVDYSETENENEEQQQEEEQEVEFTASNTGSSNWLQWLGEDVWSTSWSLVMVAVAVCLCVGVTWFCRRRQRQKYAHEYQNVQMQHQPTLEMETFGSAHPRPASTSQSQTQDTMVELSDANMYGQHGQTCSVTECEPMMTNTSGEPRFGVMVHMEQNGIPATYSPHSREEEHAYTLTSTADTSAAMHYDGKGGFGAMKSAVSNMTPNVLQYVSPHTMMSKEHADAHLYDDDVDDIANVHNGSHSGCSTDESVLGQTLGFI